MFGVCCVGVQCIQERGSLVSQVVLASIIFDSGVVDRGGTIALLCRAEMESRAYIHTYASVWRSKNRVFPPCNLLKAASQTWIRSRKEEGAIRLVERGRTYMTFFCSSYYRTERLLRWILLIPTTTLKLCFFVCGVETTVSSVVKMPLEGLAVLHNV